ncbi:hypothetical protein IHQ71_08040 [Rhizobium sp. TH2]|uniref:hypothetical protein n=1 Tax=Rhizobium sp. TH2 TaxID=2775403 RepID=UPI002157E2D8|nr:hypothetical protein [Rhizobium sp. TH2]UVC10530.1 hypothetical protein IHQ71_08040 [Rhizobium sp. TH2]
MDDEYVPAPPPSRGIYSAELITLYGVKLNKKENHAEFEVGQNDGSGLRVQLYRNKTECDNSQYSVVLGYGYAFDGHCYRFDSLRVFIVNEDAEPAVGCGFDSDPAKPAYHMWRVRSSADLLEITLGLGDAKMLLLDANLPGKRAPTSYAIHMSMAHRGGRLTRE